MLKILCENISHKKILYENFLREIFILGVLFFVVAQAYENILTMKVSRFTVHSYLRIVVDRVCFKAELGAIFLDIGSNFS